MPVPRSDQKRALAGEGRVRVSREKIRLLKARGLGIRCARDLITAPGSNTGRCHLPHHRYACACRERRTLLTATGSRKYQSGPTRPWIIAGKMNPRSSLTGYGRDAMDQSGTNEPERNTSSEKGRSKGRNRNHTSCHCASTRPRTSPTMTHHEMPRCNTPRTDPTT